MTKFPWVIPIMLEAIRQAKHPVTPDTLRTIGVPAVYDVFLASYGETSENSESPLTNLYQTGGAI